MGVVANVGFSEFPIQSDWVGKRIRVCFAYRAADTIMGTVVRDDREEPGRMIIRLDDGRYVLSTECQHSLPEESPTP